MGGEEAGEFGVLHDDGGVVLDGLEIHFLKSVAGFGGDKHFAGEIEGYGGVSGSDGNFAGKSFVDADDKFRNIVKPGELRVVDDEAEQFAGVDRAIAALIGAALHFEKGFVQAEQGDAESDELFAGGAVITGALRRIRRRKGHT